MIILSRDSIKYLLKRRGSGSDMVESVIEFLDSKLFRSNRIPHILAETKTFPDFLLTISYCHGNANYQCMSLSVSNKMGVKRLPVWQEKNVHRKRHGKTDRADPEMTSEPKVGQRICLFKENGERDSKEKAARTTVKKKKKTQLALLGITRN